MSDRDGLRPPLWRELVLGLAVFGVYAAVAGRDASGRAAVAHAHARDLFALERALHLDVEPALNAWLVPHPVLRVAANYEYATTYVVSAFVLLFWVLARRPEVYRWARTSFVLLNLSAVAVFALWPLAPPRLLPDLGFVDTVSLGRTWGSWGSPVGDHANQFAAMPSLHFAWAVWVSVVLAAISAGRRTQLVSAVHVLVTSWVVVATGNHFVLDAVAGVLLAWACVAAAGLLGREAAGPDVPAADVFFLHVETPTAPQVVGGALLLDTSALPGGALTRDDVAARVRHHLADLPVLHRRPTAPSWWHRPRWVAEVPDLDRHVVAADVSGPDGRPGGEEAYAALVARTAEQLLPRDRPLWRLVVVSGVAPGRTGVLLVLHHALADGIGTVQQVLRLLDAPPLRLGVAAGGGPGGGRGGGAGRLRPALATAAGVAQLARDGADPCPWPGTASARRTWTAVDLPLPLLRTAAREAGASLGDVVLSLVAGAVTRTAGPGAGAAAGAAAGRPLPPHLRAAVSLTLRRSPGPAGDEGNRTAAVFVDLPLGPQDERERLAEVARRARRLASGRAPASRFVQRALGEVLPPPLHAAFARAAYGRRFLSAVVATMPGPPTRPVLAGAPLERAGPVLPLAPGTPLAVGALGVGRVLHVGIATDPALLPATGLAAAVSSTLEDLRRAAGPAPQRTPGRAAGRAPEEAAAPGRRA